MLCPLPAFTCTGTRHAVPRAALPHALFLTSPWPAAAAVSHARAPPLSLSFSTAMRWRPSFSPSATCHRPRWSYCPTTVTVAARARVVGSSTPRHGRPSLSAGTGMPIPCSPLSRVSTHLTAPPSSDLASPSSVALGRVGVVMPLSCCTCQGCARRRSTTAREPHDRAGVPPLPHSFRAPTVFHSAAVAAAA